MHGTPRYPPYEHTKDQIRLLYFVDHPQSNVNNEHTDAAIIACAIEVFDLNDLEEETHQLRLQKAEPELTVQDATKHESRKYRWGGYIAMSYTWYPKHPFQQIIVNGETVTVAHNLAHGLKSLSIYLRATGQNTKIWNDFLCIDQNNQAEMQRELKRMSYIFSNAYGVISYVGPATDDSDLALQRIAKFENIVSRPVDAIDTLGGITNDEWVAITKLLQRPYWRRMWVVQEMALLGQKTVLMCGNFWTTMPSLWRLANLIVGNASLCHGLLASALKEDIYSGKLRTELFAVCARLQFVQVVSEALHMREDGNMLDILNLCRGSLQQDARDKVYGILGLLPVDVSELIEPDLNRAVHTVYADLITAVVRAKDRLDVIQNCRINRHGPPVFPTWAPDLQVYAFSHPLGSRRIINADGGRASGARFSKDGRHLICRGIVLDEIDHLTPPQWPLEPISQDQWQELRPVSPKYQASDWHATEAVLWKTLVGDRADVNSDFSAPEQYRCLLQIPWPRKSEIDSNLDVHEFAQHLIDLGWCTMNERQDLLTFLWFRERATQQFDVCGHPLGDFFTNSAELVMKPGLEHEHDLRYMNKALHQASATLKRRRFCVTSNGLLGVPVNEARRGDKIAILQGCNVPMILRTVSSITSPMEDGHMRNDQAATTMPTNGIIDIQYTGGDATLQFAVVGDCYVSGYMQGEAFTRRNDCVLQDIVLC